MASAEIALVCGLKVRVGCQDRLCVNSDMFQVCYVTSELSKHIRVNENLFVWALTGIVYSNLLYRLPTSRLILAFGV